LFAGETPYGQREIEERLRQSMPRPLFGDVLTELREQLVEEIYYRHNKLFFSATVSTIGDRLNDLVSDELLGRARRYLVFLLLRYRYFTSDKSGSWVRKLTFLRAGLKYTARVPNFSTPFFVFFHIAHRLTLIPQTRFRGLEPWRVSHFLSSGSRRKLRCQYNARQGAMGTTQIVRVNHCAPNPYEHESIIGSVAVRKTTIDDRLTSSLTEVPREPASHC
jgi:hypothetical protein